MAHPPTNGLAHVALRCRDLAALEAFYQVLGFRVVWRPDPANVYLSSGRDNLALHQEPEPAVPPPPGPDSRLDHLGVLVPAPADVDRWAAHLAAHGLTPEAPPRDHRDGSRSFYVKDPEGNRLQVIFIPAPAA
ncbi:MAG TPA: VOC family protein [Polyangia bacterium]|jgi:catechol 2,3-dioxygenase-like lactoylglutathione lyase family enzyme